VGFMLVVVRLTEKVWLCSLHLIEICAELVHQVRDWFSGAIPVTDLVH